MVFPETPSAALAWHLLTRLGEAQILLPAWLLACAWLTWRAGAGRVAAAWLGATALAAGLTTASKVAFIGYGWGWPALDFTGISGHATFAAAIWPPLLRLAAGSARPGAERWGSCAGWVLALAVGVSRVPVHAHSWSEVLAGLVVGGLACAWALRAWAGVDARPLPPLPRWRGLPLALALWATLGVQAAPPSRTHDWVTRLALAASGRAQPFLRGQVVPALKAAWAGPAAAAGVSVAKSVQLR